MLVIGLPFEQHTPESFHDYVTSLYKAPDTLPDSTSAAGVRISFNKKGTLTVRCHRESKELTEGEVVLLAQEYKQELVELTEKLTKRGFVIKNQEGQVTNAKPRSNRRGKATKSTAQRDAERDKELQWQANSADKLFISITDSGVPQESSLLPEPGTQSK